jgi:hypothetical protein
MKTDGKWRKTAWVLSAAGIIGLASFGVYNTMNSINSLSQAQNADTAIYADTSVNDYSTGGGCSPYGCAACSVCTQLQYAPNTIVVTATAAQSE